ncbi:hypothetical protein F511_28168 [Dorcoceras hygrometricum]|uniref:Uncharacterized protein n=1 Tax=Dorcoceras hygrometricum TaxID=472368 RepID=A0A2Z7AZM2_9LAMI|nr:hypothetical protein F511_28168 [Dorcoceras hygrometricum]
MAERRRAWRSPTARMCARGIARWPRDGQQLPADACCCSVQVVALLAVAISCMDAPPAGRCPVQWLRGLGLLDVRIDRAMMCAAVPHMLRRARGLLPCDLLAAAAAVRPPSDSPAAATPARICARDYLRDLPRIGVRLVADQWPLPSRTGCAICRWTLHAVGARWLLISCDGMRQRLGASRAMRRTRCGERAAERHMLFDGGGRRPSCFRQRCDG